MDGPGSRTEKREKFQTDRREDGDVHSLRRRDGQSSKAFSELRGNFQSPALTSNSDGTICAAFPGVKTTFAVKRGSVATKNGQVEEVSQETRVKVNCVTVMGPSTDTSVALVFTMRVFDTKSCGKVLKSTEALYLQTL